MLRIGLISTVAFLAACTASTDPVLKPVEIQEPQNWEEHKRAMTSFSYTISWVCECLPEDSGPFLVRANADSVLDVRRLKWPNDTVPVTDKIQFYSIDSLFARTLAMSIKYPDDAVVRYHTQYAFPDSVCIPCSLVHVDGAAIIQIKNFEPLYAN